MSLPMYAKYRETGIEWVPAAPAAWAVERFSLHTRTHRDSVTPQQLNGQIVFHYSIPSIQDTGTGSEEEGSSIDSNKLLIQEPQLLVSKLNPHKQVVILVEPKQGLQTVASTEFVPLIPTRSDPGYIKYVWQSPVCKNYLQARCDSATRSHQRASPEDITKMSWAWPSTDEQSAIAAFLDRESAKIDALIAEQQKLIALLAEKRQATISHAVTKGLNPDAPMKDSGVPWLGDVPAHWEVRSISSVSTKITNGYVGPTRDVLVDKGVRYLQSLHIKKNRIRFDTPYYVSEEWSRSHSKSILYPGDVLIVQTGDIGQSAVVTEDFAGCNCHALIIVAPLRSSLEGAWLSWVLNSTFGVHSLLSIQTGALHPHLNCGNVKQLYVPLPPISEQREITTWIEQSLLKFEQLADEAGRAAELLRERRSALIAAAVTGQIDVRGVMREQAA